MKNVGHGVKIVQAYPMRSPLPLYMGGKSTRFLLKALLDIFRNSFDLGVGVRFADDKEIRRGIV